MDTTWRESLLRPGLIAWLACCLAGLGLGLWPGAVWPTEPDFLPPPLPVLQTLAVAQAVYFLLVHPLVLLAGPVRPGWADLLEVPVLVGVSLPMLLGGAWLADAVGGDVLRVVLAVLAVGPAGVAAGRLLRRPGWRGPVLVAMLLLAVGMGGVWYLTLDFLPGRAHEVLWRAWPLGWTSSAGTSRTGGLWPGPIWAWLLCPAVGLAGWLGSVLMEKTKPTE